MLRLSITVSGAEASTSITGAAGEPLGAFHWIIVAAPCPWISMVEAIFKVLAAVFKQKVPEGRTSFLPAAAAMAVFNEAVASIEQEGLFTRP
jgi:hypothetical protein